MDRSASLGDRLKRLRGKRDAVEVAKLIGISKSALYTYESGERIPDVAIAYRLAQLYGVTVEDLVGGEDQLRVSEAMAAALYSADRTRRAAEALSVVRDLHRKLESIVKEEGEKLMLIDDVLNNIKDGR